MFYTFHEEDGRWAVGWVRADKRLILSTLDAFASIIANNQNEVLKRLTSLTLILTVPTLIASIYGMNTPIPYKNSPYTFWIPVIISFIILIVAGWNYFKRIRKTKLK